MGRDDWPGLGACEAESEDMADLQSLDHLSVALGYLVPGLIILYVRAQFLTGRLRPHHDEALGYLTVSVIYLSIVQAITSALTGSTLPLHLETPYYLPILLIGAVAFGILTGLNASFGLTRLGLRKIGISIPHVMRSAWDFRFSRFSECLMIVTLTDGSRVSGWCGRRSFVGSDPASQDIYLEQVYDVDGDGNWSLRTPGKSIYIMSGEVRLIEFIPADVGRST